MREDRLGKGRSWKSTGKESEGKSEAERRKMYEFDEQASHGKRKES
jgi:hypothetical protein